MKLISYNIHKGFGGSDWRYHLERVIAVLTAEQPDLVCLQEVDTNVKRTRFDDQPAILADRLQLGHSFFQLTVAKHQGGYGNLILSRWPFRSTQQVSLRLAKRKPRGAQLAVVETPQGLLHLVNWHLGLAEQERRYQADQLMHHPRFHEWSHLPTLIAGDTNDWRNRLMRWCFEPHLFELVTAPVKQFRTFPAFFAVSGLDKVYRRGAVDVRQVRVVKTPLARRASDHLPLMLELGLSSLGHDEIEHGRHES